MGSGHRKCLPRIQDQGQALHHCRPLAGPEFGDLQGHLLVMKKGLYGTRSAGARWHDQLFDTLSEIGFVPLKADPHVCM